MKVKIVTDSTSDLSPEVCRKLDITVVPLKVSFGDRVYSDGVDLSNEEFYRMIDTEPVFPQTAAPSPGSFTQVYRKLSENADAVLSIHISPNLSATLESARIAVTEAGVPVELIDSESASMGLGLLTIMAAEASADGASIEELKKLLAEAIPNVMVYGLFDTLQYLQRGGRIGRAQALVGTMLRVKPILAIRHGEIIPVRKTRTWSHGLNILRDLVYEKGTPVRLSVMQSSGATDADELANRLSTGFDAGDIQRAKIGPVIGTHVGPRAVGASVVYGQR